MTLWNRRFPSYTFTDYSNLVEKGVVTVEFCIENLLESVAECRLGYGSHAYGRMKLRVLLLSSLPIPLTSSGFFLMRPTSQQITRAKLRKATRRLAAREKLVPYLVVLSEFYLFFGGDRVNTLRVNRHARS